MIPEEIRNRTILVTPLNWGLGHATRSYPIIKRLISNNNRVILASDGGSLLWLKNEFKDLTIHSLPELKMKYSKSRGAMGGIILKLPHFLKSIKKDFKSIARIIEKENIDLIISDNRYGAYSSGIHSIIITHQLRINHPLGKMLNLPFKNLIEKFDEVWVPDFDNNELSGDLSKPYEKFSIPVIFIGPQSRFGEAKGIKKEFKYLSIVSGPEPHKSQLNQAIEAHFKKLDTECAMVLGNARDVEFVKKDKLAIWSNPSTSELESLIDKSEVVICRSGYSSIMDMHIKQKRVLLIPTPGQPEQIYLAKHHDKSGLFTGVFTKKDFLDFVN